MSRKEESEAREQQQQADDTITWSALSRRIAGGQVIPIISSAALKERGESPVGTRGDLFVDVDLQRVDRVEDHAGSANRSNGGRPVHRGRDARRPPPH